MNLKAFKYCAPLTLYLLAFIAFHSFGWFTWLPLVYAWVLLPVVELFIKPWGENMQAAEAALATKDPVYDYLLYGFVLLQFIALYVFLLQMQTDILTGGERAGRIISMGLLCGTFGINIGHELGHRVSRFERALAKASLLTSLYMHFFIEHNKGHHKHVATPSDPSSARYNEPVYFFYFRSIFLSYRSAWRIAHNDQIKKGNPKWSFQNEMVQIHIIQLLFTTALFAWFGITVGLYFLCAAAIGMLLLETVNYIEHYGLQRMQSSATGTYERAMPHHSWNSNHLLGRLMLFELSRHSDHHYMASKKYQVLQNHVEAPQLPTGYPGSMLLAMVPPAWFYCMNRRIRQYQNKQVSVVNELQPS